MGWGVHAAGSQFGGKVHTGCARLKGGCMPGVINRSSVVRSKVGNQ